MHTQFIIFMTIVRREMNRIFRIWTQTLIPPVLNQSLYFVIFGGVVGANIAISWGISYATFLMPGLVAMGWLRIPTRMSWVRSLEVNSPGP
jgi:ABC-2 type transport system permease protein